MSDLDKLREKAQAAIEHGSDWYRPGFLPKSDGEGGLRAANTDDTAFILEAKPTTILALIDRLQRVETALQDICSEGCTIGGEAGDCREEWPVEGADWYDDSWCDACVARAALEGGSE
jgi:hypothetical protein